MFRESLAVQDWLAEGRVEGHSEGRVAGLRESLGLVVKARFPDLRASQSIDSICDADALDGLIMMVAKARSGASVLRAIEQAAKPS